MRLAMVATHPIQYFAPLLRELASRADVELMVFFAHRPSAEHQGDGFGVSFEWDIDITGGFPHQFMDNVARVPAVGFHGYDCPEVGKLLQPDRFDFVILQGWGWKCFWQAALACRRAGIPFGVRSDSQLPQGRHGSRDRVKEWIKARVYPLFISLIPLCLPYGERSAEYFRRYGARRIGMAPHSIDNAFFAENASKAAGERGRWRKKYGVPEHAFCFLFCGKFIPKKRPGDVIDALLRLLKMETLSVHLLMVGSGVLEDVLHQQSAPAAQNVSFVGFINQSSMPAVYAAADCLVLPSDSGETWGLVVNEAMACAVPAIVSDSCGCVPDLIQAGVTGYSYPQGDIAELTGKMRIMAEPEKAKWMGQQAKARVNEGFSVALSANRLSGSIRNLLVAGEA